jgi:class 3 adenylate cyclase
MAAARVDRRLAAILAADVVGYSRLTEQDEAGTLGRLKGHRKSFIEPLIAEHQGRLVKLMGDGSRTVLCPRLVLRCLVPFRRSAPRFQRGSS